MINYKIIELHDQQLRLLDQRFLPSDTVYIECKNYRGVIDAIEKMVVRGAPAIAIAGAWACVLAATELKSRESILKAFEDIENARPTAVSLSRAVGKLRKAYLQDIDVNQLKDAAREIAQSEREKCERMSAYGITVLPNKSSYKLLTHCNTGHLATGGIGTALGVFMKLKELGKRLTAYATETRPYLQGARLTSWELVQNDIETYLLPDAAASWLMEETKLDAVLVGADRIAANGDTANKIGTYQLALAANEHAIPFYVVAPLDTVDASVATGREIQIEERPPTELIIFNDRQIAPTEVKTFNPAFDITPNRLINGFVTDQGVFTPEKLKAKLI